MMGNPGFWRNLALVVIMLILTFIGQIAPICPTEDSSGCIWICQIQGNQKCGK